MLSWVYMKILESRPVRYDRGIRILSLGRAEAFRRAMVETTVRSGDRVLDIGTGTGSLAMLAAEAGATVTGIDPNAGMLEQARLEAGRRGLTDRITFIEAGIAEMDALFEDVSFDVATASLVFSELSLDERGYALDQLSRVLVASGRLAIADEVRPGGIARRALHAAVRLPLAAVTYALTQTTTRPVDGLEKLVEDAGFDIESIERLNLESLMILLARRRP